jgi:hypothetical protein
MGHLGNHLEEQTTRRSNCVGCGDRGVTVFKTFVITKFKQIEEDWLCLQCHQDRTAGNLFDTRDEALKALTPVAEAV